MRCPNCGEDTLVQDTRDLPYEYKERTITISSISGEFCSNCDEAVLSQESSARLSHELLAFRKSVNASIVSPAWLRSVREKLGLSQQSASELFEQKANVFARYEDGRLLPPASVLGILRLLDLHPEMLPTLLQSSIPQPPSEAKIRSSDEAKQLIETLGKSQKRTEPSFLEDVIGLTKTSFAAILQPSFSF